MEIAPPISTLQALEAIRHALETAPKIAGHALSEGLQYILRGYTTLTVNHCEHFSKSTMKK
jgi:hypothetical protein